MSSRKLVLFDIDGTLITDHGAAREAYDVALREVYGYSGDLHQYDFSGRTDPQITMMVLGDADYSVEEIEEGFDALWHRYLAELGARATRDRVEALRGVRPVIEALETRHDVMLGLLTGNIEPGARIKLAAPGLNGYFPFGAFGSDSTDRNALAPIAIERASKIDGHRFAGRDVVIIGDSIYDVRCGVPHDATTIAVASGRTAGDLLRAEHPHFYFDSLENIDQVVAAILGPGPGGLVA